MSRSFAPQITVAALAFAACAVERGPHEGGPPPYSSTDPTTAPNDDDGEGEDESSDIPDDAWPIGGWYSPLYLVGDGSDKPFENIVVHADGTWRHRTGEDVDAEGEWELVDGELWLDGEPIARLPNCMAIHLPDLGDAGHDSDFIRIDAPTGECPDAIPALTDAERCLLGEFVHEWEQNLAITRFIDTFDEHRLHVQHQIYVGHEDGDADITTARYWYLDGENLCEQAVGGAPSCITAPWGEYEAHRTTQKDPACVLPVDPNDFYCADSTGVVSGGIGCLRENREGPVKWIMSCDEETLTCTCTRDGVVLWEDFGDSYACFDSAAADDAWADCCGA